MIARDDGLSRNLARWKDIVLRSGTGQTVDIMFDVTRCRWGCGRPIAISPSRRRSGMDAQLQRRARAAGSAE